jgi:uncharacterized protein (TIGR04141 family)
VRSRKFSLFLIKNSIKDTSGIIKNYQSLKQFALNISGLTNAVLFVKKLPSRPPKWLSLFEHVIPPGDIASLRSSLVSGVLLVKRRSRTFALTFGYGRALLEPGCFEERFGLKVTLNSIDPDSIRSIDKKSFDSPIYVHSRDQASREGTVNDFGLNVDQDLLRSITGKPSTEDLGHRLSGADALSITVKANLSDLPSLLDKMHEKFRDTSYKEHFSWVDHFSEVKDKPLINNLNETLIGQIKEGNFDRLWMSIPEIEDWTNIRGFRYTSSTKGDALDDIDFVSFLSNTNIEDIDIKWLKRKKVYAFNIEDSAPYKPWRAFDCIYCEIERDGDTYLLSGGTWYRIATNYVADINNQYSRIPIAHIDLPICTEFSEEEYNKRVHRENHDSIALMDRKNIVHGGGRSRIEFCDLYTKSGKIIHVKKYGTSSVLSHLVNQGLVSGRLFHIDPHFREKVNEKFPPAFKLASPREQIQPANYEIVYAIISREEGERVTLPFFSRVGLVLAVQQLRGYGYKASLKKIPVPR